MISHIPDRLFGMRSRCVLPSLADRRGDPDLAENGGQIPVDRATADNELFSHLGVVEPLCQQTQHLIAVPWLKSGSQQVPAF